MSRLLRPRGPSSLLSLPPTIQQSIHLYRQHGQLQGERSFVDLAAVPASIPAMGMSGLHSIGIPWWAVLPLSAFLIRTFVVLPRFTQPFRQAYARRALLQPLIDAKMSWNRRRTLRLNPGQSWTVQRLNVLLSRWKTHREIGHQFKANPSFFTRLGGVLVLLAVSEGIRRMCGTKEGLLTLMLGPFNSAIAYVMDMLPKSPESRKAPVENQKRALTVISVVESAREKLGMQSSTPNNSQNIIENTSIPSTTTADAAAEVENGEEMSRSTWYQPSLTTGGPFWCPDITKPDPTGNLPFIFGATWIATIYFSQRIARQPQNPDDAATATSSKDGARSRDESRPRGQYSLTNLQRIVMTVALLSIYPALQMPSALLLYYISNIGIGALQTRYLARKIPIRIAPSGCRRPVRANPMRERIDPITTRGS